MACLVCTTSTATRAQSSRAGVSSASTTAGAQVFQQSCAGCYTGAADSRAPGLDALRARSPQAVLESLLTGAMRPQGSRLSGLERRAVAEYVTGKTIEGDVRGATSGRCDVSTRTRASTSTPTRQASWSG